MKKESRAFEKALLRNLRGEKDKLKKRLKNKKSFEEWITECAEKENRERLEEDEPFNERLLEYADGYKERQAASKKQVVHNERLSLFEKIAAPVCVIVLALVISLSYFFGDKGEQPYLGHLERRDCDITEVNTALNLTQLPEGFATAILAYNSESLKTYYFIAAKEITTEEVIINCTMTLIVDRDYQYDEGITDYTESFSYLDFTVEYTESVQELILNEIPVNEFTVKAYMDTGQERVYFTYSELTVENSSSFNQKIQEFITKK